MRGLKLCSLAGYLALLRAEGIYGSSTTQDSASVLLEPLVHPTGPVNGLSLAGSVEPTAVEARGEDNDSGSSEKSGLLLGEGAYVYSTAGGETSFLLAPLVRREGPAEGLSVEPTAAEAKSKETASGDSGASEEKSDTPYISVSFLRGDTAEDVTEECIKEHNKKRVGKLSHPLMPVGRNSDAIAQAMKYMRQVVAEGCPFKHSDAGGFGENLFATSGPVAHCTGAVHAWYSEISYLNGTYPGANWPMKAGHFIQMMWHSSTGIGCARTVGCPGSILVCNYKPPGNMVGSAPFTEEVWESIMKASGDLGAAVITRFACLFTVVVATLTSVAITAA